VGGGRVISGLSGGVDSAVASVLIHEAIGDQLTCIFVDHGLLRQAEAEEVVRLFRGHYNIPLVHVDARERFLKALDEFSERCSKGDASTPEFGDIDPPLLPLDLADKGLVNAKPPGKLDLGDAALAAQIGQHLYDDCVLAAVDWTGHHLGPMVPGSLRICQNSLSGRRQLDARELLQFASLGAAAVCAADRSAGPLIRSGAQRKALASPDWAKHSSQRPMSARASRRGR